MHFKTLDIAGAEPAIQGMRNPLQSHDKSDSHVTDGYFIIGDKDYDLAKRLILAGPEHRKFLRQIVVWVNISAPRFWWSEFDTYKIGTSANSESTMHTLLKKPITRDMFEIDFNEDDLKMFEDFDPEIGFDGYLYLLEEIRQFALSMPLDEKKYCHKLLKQMLPESFIQTRTVCLNYEVLSNMYQQRKNHKLPQWREDFVSWIKTLPHSEFITKEFDKD